MSPRRGSSEVRATRMKCCASPAPVMNHLRPVTTKRSPRFSARVLIIAGSEPPPGAGSVIAKEERALPSTIGRSHFSFCAGVPMRASKLMLPSSGAMQLNASAPKMERAASSYITAQATIGSAMPPNSLGDCGAHKPACLRLRLHAGENIEANIFVLVIDVRPALQRQHVLFDECARAQPQVLELGRERKIHGPSFLAAQGNHLAAIDHDRGAGNILARIGGEQQQAPRRGHHPGRSGRPGSRA